MSGHRLTPGTRTSDAGNMSTRLRVTLSTPELCTEVVVSLTRDQHGQCQGATSIGDTGHVSAGHRNECAALVHVLEWLRARLAIAPDVVATVTISVA